MPTVYDLADLLAPRLDRARYHREGDPAGVWVGSGREVARLGLRLDAGRPDGARYGWAEGLDAVLVHRPFGLWPARLPPGLGVLAAHRALDDRLSVGHNPALAAALGLAPIGAPLRRGGLPVGLVGALAAPAPAAAVEARVVAVLGGAEEAIGDAAAVASFVALAGAMTPELVAAAAERGAGVYVTGQLRPRARRAAELAGLRVVAVGQARAEAWGLRHLGAAVRERWPSIEVVELGLPPRS